MCGGHWAPQLVGVGRGGLWGAASGEACGVPSQALLALQARDPPRGAESSHPAEAALRARGRPSVRTENGGGWGLAARDVVEGGGGGGQPGM